MNFAVKDYEIKQSVYMFVINNKEACFRIRESCVQVVV